MKETFFTILTIILCVFCVISEIGELSVLREQYWILGAIFLILILVYFLKKAGNSIKKQLLILFGLVIFFAIVFFIEIKFSYL